MYQLEENMRFRALPQKTKEGLIIETIEFLYREIPAHDQHAPEEQQKTFLKIPDILYEKKAISLEQKEELINKIKESWK